METCHNMKKEIPVVPTITVKSTKTYSMDKNPTYYIKKTFVRYPYIICFNIEHRFKECPRKIEVQNIFRTKPVSFNATITPKSLKIDNVSINVVVVVTICSQRSK